jgi:hypothetical protein
VFEEKKAQKAPRLSAFAILVMTLGFYLMMKKDCKQI